MRPKRGMERRARRARRARTWAARALLVVRSPATLLPAASSLAVPALIGALLAMPLPAAPLRSMSLVPGSAPAGAVRPAPPRAQAPGGEHYRLVIQGDRPIFSRTAEVTISGATDAPPGATVTVSLTPITGAAAAPAPTSPASPGSPGSAAAPASPGPQRPDAGEPARPRTLPGAGPEPPPRLLPEHFDTLSVPVAADRTWTVAWPEPLAAGTYEVTARVDDGRGGAGMARNQLVVQLPGTLPRRPLLAAPEDYAPAPVSAAGDFQPTTDRWRIVPPPYEINERGSRWDPYHQNRWKGDLPIRGQDLFLNLSAVSDSLVEARTLPTPSGASSRRPASPRFFGRDGQLFATETAALSADLFHGDTAFKPVDWRFKATIAGNFNDLRVAENGVVNPDVRRGTARQRGFLALQEAFGEVKLADLSPSYDFLSLRAGIQPFASDFRGFVFTDTNLGVRLFGSLEANRDQYNLALFDRLEKDTNSGLNTFSWRRQQVAVANFFRQDFLTPGYTASASLHLLRDEASFAFDKNGFLSRPDPVGSFTPHQVRALYLGWAGLGHAGRVNLDHAFYYVAGSDSLNPIAGPDPAGGGHDGVEIRALMAALELSVDLSWLRPKLAYFYASGDGRPTDRRATGFDSIFDDPAFAGGGFSFWNRLGLQVPGLGVALVNRGSLLPDLRSSKEEGQPNFVNPGLHLVSAALAADLTPELHAELTANHLRFDQTATLELLLFQAPIRPDIGWDLSLGVRWRPFLNNQIRLAAGVAALLPGRGFRD